MENILKRNNVRIIGDGKKTVIFGHGFGCSQQIWNIILPFFEKDYRIVLYDYVGSGDSDFNAYDSVKYSNLYGYVQDLQDVLEALEIKKAFYVGHSVSSMIGALASIRNTDYFERMVFISPSPRYLNELPDYYGGFEERDIEELLKMMEMNYIGWASANAAILMDNTDRPMLAEDLKDAFAKENPFIMKNFAQATFLSDHRKELSLITTPSMIIQCSVDSIVPIEVAEYLKFHLKESILRVIDAKGHYPHVSNPKDTAAMIRQYLTGKEG